MSGNTKILDDLWEVIQERSSSANIKILTQRLC